MNGIVLFQKRGIFQKLLVALMLISCTSCVYMKMNPPPDADKTFLLNNNSCYLATASNMLAGAGYGDGNTVQDRTDDIYGEMTINFGTINGGWTDAALTSWLGSTDNTWTNNPYTVVTVYGNKTRTPWANQDGAQDIGNELRMCNFVGLSISWPPDATHATGYGGHAITGWGDEVGWNTDTLTSDPDQVRLVDSDQDTGGDVQAYEYDAYTNPNPSGNNSGNGWYIDYSTNHPFIKHIVTLSPTLGATGNVTTQRVLGSYKITQNSQTDATDLHYTVGTDVNILSYRTWLSWFTETPHVISEADPRRSITVDWDLSANPVPMGKEVTINTEFILPRWNAIYYDDVRFTYPRLAPVRVGNIAWRIDTPLIYNATKIPNVTGGYVVGSFDIIAPSSPANARVVGQYRFVHQYSFDQSPERHVLTLQGERGNNVANLRIGHSYGYLDEKALWKFSDWITDFSEKIYKLSDEPVKVTLDWTGKLPYPEGEMVPWSKNLKLHKLYLKP